VVEISITVDVIVTSYSLSDHSLNLKLSHNFRKLRLQIKITSAGDTVRYNPCVFLLIQRPSEQEFFKHFLILFSDQPAGMNPPFNLPLMAKIG